MLKPDRVEYSPIIDRPRLRWPNGARVALWVVPNVEHYEYLPLANKYRNPWPRSPHPDVMNYSYRDYGNRVGFWRMLEVFDKHQIKATVSLNVAVLEHFPEILEAMVERNWEYLSHGIYNTRLLSGMNEDEERAFYHDTVTTVEKLTGKRMKGMLGPSLTNNEHTPDLMTEAGFIYHADWNHDDQPIPIKVRSGRLISVPYSIELNDVMVRLQGEDAAYFAKIIRDQFDTLYQEGAENGRVMCIALHPYWIGQPHRVKYLDKALSYILQHEGVWQTTGEEIAKHYLNHYYDKIISHVAKRTEEWALLPQGEQIKKG